MLSMVLNYINDTNELKMYFYIINIIAIQTNQQGINGSIHVFLVSH